MCKTQNRDTEKDFKTLGICIGQFYKTFPRIMNKNGSNNENKLTDASSTKIDGSFFSVAMTTPFAAARIKYQISIYKLQLAKYTAYITGSKPSTIQQKNPWNTRVNNTNNCRHRFEPKWTREM